jgi:hypothetical protein
MVSDGSHSIGCYAGVSRFNCIKVNLEEKSEAKTLS